MTGVKFHIQSEQIDLPHFKLATTASILIIKILRQAIDVSISSLTHTEMNQMAHGVRILLE